MALAKVIPFVFNKNHACFPLALKYNGACPLCEEHKEKKKKFIKQARWRARMRQGIVV
jgi:hypothetical protein